MDLYESIIYIQQCYLFLSVQWKKKKPGYKMAEEDKQTMLLGLNKGNLFSIFFFPRKGGRGICSALILISSQKL